jgi:hypothetical protein
MESKSASGAKNSFMDSPSKLDWDAQGISMDMSTQGFTALDECHELLIYGANKNDESSFMNSGILNLLDTKDQQELAGDQILPSEKRPLLGLSKNTIHQRSRKRIREDSNSNKTGFHNIQKITERLQEGSQAQLQNSTKTLRSTNLISTGGSSTTGGSKKAIAKRGPSGSSSSRKEQSFGGQQPTNMLVNQRMTGIVSGVNCGKHSATMSRILENINSKQHAASQVFKQALEKSHATPLSPPDDKYELQQTSSLVHSDKFELEFTSDGNNSGQSPADGVNSPIDHSGELKQDPNSASACENSDASNSNNFIGSALHRSSKQLGRLPDNHNNTGVSNSDKPQSGATKHSTVTNEFQLNVTSKLGMGDRLQLTPSGFLFGSNVNSSNQSPHKQSFTGGNTSEGILLKREETSTAVAGFGTSDAAQRTLRPTPQNLTCSVMDSSQKAALMETIRSQKSKQSGSISNPIGIMSAFGHNEGPKVIAAHKDKREPNQTAPLTAKAHPEPQKGMMTLERIIRHHSGAGDSKSPPNKGGGGKGETSGRAGPRKASTSKHSDEIKRKEGSNGPSHKESKRNGSTGVVLSSEGTVPHRKEYKLQTLDTLLKSKMLGP